MKKELQKIVKKIMEQKQKDWEKKPKMHCCISGNECIAPYDDPKIIEQIALSNEQGLILITKEQIGTALAVYGMYNQEFQVELFIIKKNEIPKPAANAVGRDNQGGAEIKIKKIEENFIIIEIIEEMKKREKKIKI